MKITNKFSSGGKKPSPQRRRQGYVSKEPLGFEDLRNKKEREQREKEQRNSQIIHNNSSGTPTYISIGDASRRPTRTNNNNNRPSSSHTRSASQVNLRPTSSCGSIYSAPAALESPPPPPPLNWDQLQQLECVYDFEVGQTGDLQIAEGDIVCVISQEESGWWYGRNSSTGLAGKFPIDYCVAI